MLKLPIRKCFYVIKICALLLLVLSILTLFEHWRGGKRSARAQFADPVLEEYERQILEDEARIIPGLGDNGAAAYLTGEDKRLGDESEKKYAINTYLSDRISYNRTLADFRNTACNRVTYDAELPSASVIIIFHNEPYSVVIRTLWSVLNSARRSQPWYRRANKLNRHTHQTMELGYPGQDPDSEFVYLKEIILVDDNSTLPELKGKLSHYLRTRLPPGMVRLVRLPDRIGLIRARHEGAGFATGDVLVFLDAHCEANPDWLRPLLQRIKDSPHSVLTPIIDMVEGKNFVYDPGEIIDFEVGGFTFAGHFTWIDVPEREKKRRGSDIAPTWSPTMAGGLFAMSRDYYWELGAYDEQMAGWGGENLEMSFRIWQCGGTLETIPCSRVGHVFRSFHPYGLPADSDTHGINTARMAEVWMDEYAELFYLHRPDLRKNPIIGDVTHRKILREKLQCKSFQWYLDNIYQEKFVPVRDVSAYGRVKNPQSGLCLDTMQREEEASPLGVYPCHPLLSGTQYLSLSLTGQLRDEEKCAELQFVSFSMAYFLDALSSMKLQAAFNHTLTAILNTIRAAASDSTEDVSRRVLMVTCTGRQKGQQWRYLPSGQLQHVESGLCLDARGLPAGADARARPCAPPSPPSPRPSPRPAPPAQRWRFDCSDQEPAHSDLFSADQEERLRKLKRQRRKSRSLLSIESEMSPIPPDSPSPNNPPEDPIDPADGSQDTRRHRPANKHKRRKGKSKKKGKKKGHKNKFILAVERTLMNSSEEHLELDVHCAHRRLLPNDTFVRDIVTILNEHNIRVINNGRVFERNRVTEIGKLDPRTMRHKDKKILHKMEVPADGAPDERPPGTPAPLPDTPVPVTPATTTQLTTQEPAEVIQEKIIKKKRTRSKGGREHSPPPPAEPPATTAASRIIVEDFVPVRPAATTSPKQRSRKHKRKRQRSTAAPEQRAEEPEESPVLLTKRGGSGLRPSHTVHDASDVHDGPDAHDVHDGSDSDDNYWAVGIGSPKARNRPYPVVRARAGAAARGTEDAAEGGGLAFSSEEAGAGAKRSYARNNSAHQRSILERLQHHTAPPDQRESETEDAKETHDKMAARGRGRAAAAGGREDIDTEAESTPVKLVMKSNLTFNLGDELFAWRRRPDLANLLEQQLSPGRLADASSASDSSAGT